MKIAQSILLIVTGIPVARFAGAQDIFDAVGKNQQAAQSPVQAQGGQSPVSP